MNTPNQNGAPSMLWNNPVFSPFINVPADSSLLVGNVDDSAAIGDEYSGVNYVPQGPWNVLMGIRARFPFLPISPVPTEVVTVALVQNAALTVSIPQGAVLCKFTGAGNYFVDLQANARIPTAGNPTSSIYKPDDRFYYINGIAQLSLITPDAAGSYVTLACYSVPELG